MTQKEDLILEADPFRLKHQNTQEQIAEIRQQFANAQADPQRTGLSGWKDILSRLHWAHRACLVTQDHIQSFVIVGELALAKYHVLDLQPK